MREPENNNYKPIFQSFFKPITEKQTDTTREITEGLSSIKEGIEAITFPAYPSIQASEKPFEGEEDAPYIGEIAKTYLKRFTTKDEADRTYGFYDKAGKFYIGNKLAIIVDNDLVLVKMSIRVPPVYGS